MDRRPRARDLGIPFSGRAGELNAITDVVGLAVGHATIVQGEGQLDVGNGPVRTGVTAILPRGFDFTPCLAGWYALNGNGEMTGTTWIEESGFLEGPVMITNTHSVGVVRDAVIAWMNERNAFDPLEPNVWWGLPVVGETWDGWLNDINGFHVTPQHAYAALDSARGGAVEEGAVGGGTGMICHRFKGGIGSASRIAGDHTVGVLVQCNHGDRDGLSVAGVPVGREINDLLPEPGSGNGESPDPGGRTGSIIVVVATDAPVLPHQLKRMARRVPMGIARVGGTGEDGSGDIFVAFSTANRQAWQRGSKTGVEMLANDLMTPLFRATVEAVEEAIVNAIVAADTTVGINGNTVHAIPHERLREVLRKYQRLS